MKPLVTNLFIEASPEPPVELIQPLLHGESFRLESIHSFAQPSPEGFWYDQEGGEWVFLARGFARLEFEGYGLLELKPGDYLVIPERCRHRVDFVSGDAVWLALHAPTRVDSTS
jgi:cupin 2 domain-containing protein